MPGRICIRDAKSSCFRSGEGKATPPAGYRTDAKHGDVTHYVFDAAGEKVIYKETIRVRKSLNRLNRPGMGMKPACV